MACALFESLLMNRPFVDRHKRVAFFAMDVFLRLNGWRLVVEAEQATSSSRSTERGEADYEHLLPGSAAQSRDWNARPADAERLPGTGRNLPL